ncbi:MAG TPA: hypothetical protein VKA10_00585, partial [Prolixibacteraceae bacterium]|nr:hypothetical protein [Prolixibacteraceae bacterium]
MKSYPNILIVQGSGRNVGKTLAASRIIENLAKKNKIVAVKISPHFHELEEEKKFIHRSEGFIIVEEQRITQKDSSRMLQNGAEKVYYVQAKNEFLPDVLNEILKRTEPNQPVIIETGGLYDYMEPGLLLYIEDENPKKKVMVRNDSKVLKLTSFEVWHFDWDL